MCVSRGLLLLSDTFLSSNPCREPNAGLRSRLLYLLPAAAKEKAVVGKVCAVSFLCSARQATSGWKTARVNTNAWKPHLVYIGKHNHALIMVLSLCVNPLNRCCSSRRRFSARRLRKRWGSGCCTPSGLTSPACTRSFMPLCSRGQRSPRRYAISPSCPYPALTTLHSPQRAVVALARFWQGQICSCRNNTAPCRLGRSGWRTWGRCETFAPAAALSTGRTLWARSWPRWRPACPPQNLV